MYEAYVQEGVQRGRREELAGGGLIRSLGGWSEVRGLKKEGRDHIMSDDRILGDSDFLASVPLHAAFVSLFYFTKRDWLP